MVLHVALCMSERVDLWPTSISVTCQDLWVMESKPDRSESVLLKPTSGLLWDIMDEHLYPHPLPQPYHLFSFHLTSPPTLTALLPPHPHSSVHLSCPLHDYSFKLNGKLVNRHINMAEHFKVISKSTSIHGRTLITH